MSNINQMIYASSTAAAMGRNLRNAVFIFTSSFFYQDSLDGFMGLMLGDGVPLPASSGDSMFNGIT